jgi:hypothetical protein
LVFSGKRSGSLAVPGMFFLLALSRTTNAPVS